MVRKAFGPIEPMFLPTRNRILCKIIEGQHTSQSGLVLPESGPEQLLLYSVIAVGPECRYVQAGQAILLPHYAGQDIEVEGEQFTIAREPEVAAITQ